MAKKGGMVRYYVVNPAGAVHGVTREHAAARLRTVGWRVATAAEIAEYEKRTEQRFDDPIAEPWNPEPQAVEAEVTSNE